MVLHCHIVVALPHCCQHDHDMSVMSVNDAHYRQLRLQAATTCCSEPAWPPQKSAERLADAESLKAERPFDVLSVKVNQQTPSHQSNAD